MIIIFITISSQRAQRIERCSLCETFFEQSSSYKVHVQTLAQARMRRLMDEIHQRIRNNFKTEFIKAKIYCRAEAEYEGFLR